MSVPENSNSLQGSWMACAAVWQALQRPQDLLTVGEVGREGAAQLLASAARPCVAVADSDPAAFCEVRSIGEGESPLPTPDVDGSVAVARRDLIIGGLNVRPLVGGGLNFRTVASSAEDDDAQECAAARH
jgi:hypothetical protein